MEVSLTREKLDAKQMMKEMAGSYSNGAIIIWKYDKMCQLLFENSEQFISAYSEKLISQEAGHAIFTLLCSGEAFSTIPGVSGAAWINDQTRYLGIRR